MTKNASAADANWVSTLETLLTKGSLPGERAGMTPALRTAAAALATAALANRTAGQPSIEIESFAAPNGDRRLRIAVVNDDMPFLVDTVAATITRQGLIITRLLHPLIPVGRDEDGQLIGVGSKTGPCESVICLECDRGDARTRMTILRDLTANLAAVRAAVTDWAALRTAMKADAAAVTGVEAEFLNWAEGGAFTLLGHARFDGKGRFLSGKGIARVSGEPLLSPAARLAAAKAFKQGAELLIIKSNLLSPVHRAVPPTAPDAERVAQNRL